LPDADGPVTRVEIVRPPDDTGINHNALLRDPDVNLAEIVAKRR
jgi:hypothetical protein